MLNEVALEGWLVSEVKDFGSLKSFEMRFAGNPKSQYENSHFITVKTFEDSLVSGLNKGDRVVVSGRLQIGKAESNGKTYKNIAVLVGTKDGFHSIKKQADADSAQVQDAKKVFSGKEISNEEVPW